MQISVGLLSENKSYRPDIDGLRAIAVGSVIVTHAELSDFIKGGFIGVDVFFVISGYLISSILLRELSTGTFSIVKFYRRRILRILPALLAVLFVSSGLAYLYLFPDELVEFSKSALSAILSASNFFYWSQSGYFTGAASTKPLLHTWSLAIEEQFYIGFPILLYLVHHYWQRYLSMTVLLAAALSFALSVWRVHDDATSAFYLVQYRAWELLMGVIVALEIVKLPMGKFTREALAGVGLAMIVVPVFVYTPQTRFPGLAALPACLGTSMVIFAGQSGSSLTGRLLSLKPLVWIGLVSYSLYLWHWPLLVFYKLGMPFIHLSHPKAIRAILMVVAFAAAVLSWRFIEQPFRGGRMRPVSTAKIFGMGSIAAASVSLLNSVFWSFHGIPQRIPVEAVRIAAYASYHAESEYRMGKCSISDAPGTNTYDYQACLHQEHGKLNYLLIGESNAAHLYPGLLSVPDINVLQATAIGCKPTLTHQSDESSLCVALMDFIFQKYLVENRVDRLLIAALWQDSDLPALRQTLLWAKDRGIAVLLIGPIPRYDLNLPRLIAISIRDGNDQAIKDGLISLVRPLDEKMSVLANETGTPYASLFRHLCNDSSCEIFVNGHDPIQFDTVHLTKAGSEYLIGKLWNDGTLSLPAAKSLQ
jgi:peptidoglycan/LPS O-acetylase OafA/YrhL